MELLDRGYFLKEVLLAKTVFLSEVLQLTQTSVQCATVPFIKNKLKAILLNKQASGDVVKWFSENSIKK